jgi:hypothetical protein
MKYTVDGLFLWRKYFLEIKAEIEERKKMKEMQNQQNKKFNMPGMHRRMT